MCWSLPRENNNIHKKKEIKQQLNKNKKGANHYNYLSKIDTKKVLVTYDLLKYLGFQTEEWASRQDQGSSSDSDRQPLLKDNVLNGS